MIFNYNEEQHVLHIIWFTWPFDVLTNSDRCLSTESRNSSIATENIPLTIFSRSSHLAVSTKSTQNILAIMTVMGLKYSIEFTVAFSKSKYFYSHMKCHDLLGISEKV